eukprot:5006012-Heterocapsa_arctica.AAC.1
MEPSSRSPRRWKCARRRTVPLPKGGPFLPNKSTRASRRSARQKATTASCRRTRASSTSSGDR